MKRNYSLSMLEFILHHEVKVVKDYEIVSIPIPLFQIHVYEYNSALL